MVEGEKLVYQLGQGSGSTQNARVATEQEGRRLQAVSQTAELQNKKRYTLKEVKNYSSGDYQYLLFEHSKIDEIIIYQVCFELIYSSIEDITRKDKKTISKLLFKNIRETYNIGSYLITSGY